VLLVLAGYLEAPMTWICLLFGAIFGSFLNVCIYRIPAGEFWKNSRSVCRACGAPIPFYLNIPIFSWLLLRGRTACCKSKLSPQYPIVELLTAVMMVLLYWKFPFVVLKGEGLLEWDFANMLRFAHAAVFTCLLIVCSFIDLRLMIIPDVISIPMIIATPFVAAMHPDLDYRSAFLGVLLGGGVLYAIAWLYWLLRREVGMGLGDVKLLAAIGGWLGYQSIIPTIFYGSMLGALAGLGVIVGNRSFNLKTAIPFGPFLALGAIIHMIMGSYLQNLIFLQ
jgi:leader peptidase (prepilin peptidase)/N-methyltransferase